MKMNVENFEDQPKSHIENVRDRFMDFIGNPLNGVLGYLDSIQNDNLSPEGRERMLAGLKRSWDTFFRRVETFKTSIFEQTGKINQDNLDRILSFKDKDPLQVGVVEELDAVYNLIIEKL